MNECFVQLMVANIKGVQVVHIKRTIFMVDLKVLMALHVDYRTLKWLSHQKYRPATMHQREVQQKKKKNILNWQLATGFSQPFVE